jgi:hypothetical protein
VAKADATLFPHPATEAGRCWCRQKRRWRSGVAQRKTVTITAQCSDNKSAGTATTNVTVIRKAVLAAIRLPDVLFSNNNARVNNCGKRVLLEELRGYFE